MQDGSSNSEVFETGNLVVARFKGRCGRDFSDTEGQGRVLGFTHLSEGEILPFAEVDCDRVRTAIRPCLKLERGPSMEYLLGRALGRVLAHELYHILGKTNRHSETGAAKSGLRPSELVEGRLEFELGQSDAIRRALLPKRLHVESARLSK